MFSKATANFVRQIDPEGSLIHVSRVNDSHRLVSMALVVKRNRLWSWQRPKFHPTDFILSDLLLGDEVLSPEVCETDFLSYEATFGDKLSGKLNTEAGSVVNLTLEGQGTSKLRSVFGKLKKEELDVKKLLRDSRDRLVNMQHRLVQQLRKQTEVLAVVKERILTTSSCSITQTKQENCAIQGMLGIMGMLGNSVKVCVRDRNDMEADSDVSLEIPSDTVIAYSILELEIKRNGQYDICLQPGTIGGFEAESPSNESLDVVDGPNMNMDLSSLAELPQSAQCVLFTGLRGTMRDRSALSYLQCVLQDLCSGESLDLAKQEDLSDSQRRAVSVILDQLNPDSHSSSLMAAHLLVSAMEELPDDALCFLSESCPDFLKGINTLMCRMIKSSGPLPIQCLPSLLQDNQAFQLVEQLLNFTSVTLRRDTDRLWMEKPNEAAFVPLLLSVRGLSVLCNDLS
ncbi:gasdermin-E-like [Betta splendens]|uniref:Gasdermin-E-like n=1 Tax=Betta splendens TaxID=158456 RepID=A0A6P7NYI9_BETSP|nr:gasdermin-E-like [Betta splendens]